MKRSEANTVCVNDYVEDLFGRTCKVVDLEFGFDENKQSAIIATLTVVSKGDMAYTFSQNLELCRLKNEVGE